MSGGSPLTGLEVGLVSSGPSGLLGRLRHTRVVVVDILVVAVRPPSGSRVGPPGTETVVRVLDVLPPCRRSVRTRRVKSAPGTVEESHERST